MNGVKKEKLVKALCRLSASMCAYSKQPCDCKFMQDDDTRIASGSESGSGCPEITVAAIMLAHMSEQEFLSLAKRSGVSIHEDEDLQVPDVFGMIKGFQKERMDKMQTQAKPTGIEYWMNRPSASRRTKKRGSK